MPSIGDVMNGGVYYSWGKRYDVATHIAASWDLGITVQFFFSFFLVRYNMTQGDHIVKYQ